MTQGQIAVVGAGVIGLTTGLELVRRGWRVTIYADEVPGRTSLAAGASWGPYHVQPYERVAAWGGETYERLAALADTRGSGVSMVHGTEASRTASEPPEWTAALPSVSVRDASELPTGFTCGWSYTVPVIDMPSYLDYLLAQFQSAGGSVVRARLSSLGDLAETNFAVVNCSGIGATRLVDDRELFPIRGQLVVVENPGLHEFFSEDTGSSPNLCHFLPTGGAVVLGGMALANDEGMEPDPKIAEAILRRCAEIEPRLWDARVVGHRVGLRPTRPVVRLEVESINGHRVVHNYGHGGAGVSLSWGCASEVSNIIDTVQGNG